MGLNNGLSSRPIASTATLAILNIGLKLSAVCRAVAALVALGLTTFRRVVVR
jgi:hypothetical protein